MPLIGKLAGALGLGTVLWLWIDWHEATATLAAADPRLVALALLASVASVLVSVRKWQRLLDRIELRLGFGILARLYWIGSFFSNFLPTGVGGDAVRLLLTPAEGRLSAVAGSILVERLTGLLVMLLLAATGLALQPLALADLWFQETLLAAVLALAAAVATVLLAPRLFLVALDRLGAFVPGRLRGPFAKVRKIADGIVGPACDREAVAGAILYSVPFYAANIVAQFWVLRAVGAEITLAQVTLAAPVILLVGILPITINGLVLAEGAFVVIYAGCGVSPEIALAAALLRRVIDLANSSAGGLLWLGWPVGATAPLANPMAATLAQARLHRDAAYDELLAQPSLRRLRYRVGGHAA